MRLDAGPPLATLTRMASLAPAAANSSRSAALVAGAAAAAAAVLLLLMVGDWIVAAAFLAAGLIAGGAVITWRLLTPAKQPPSQAVDWDLTRAVASTSTDAVAITDRAGRLVCANDAYHALFDGYPTPPDLPLDREGPAALAQAGRAAWRDGEGRTDLLSVGDMAFSAQVVRSGEEGDMLVWRFVSSRERSLVNSAEELIAGPSGDRLGAAGVMTALLSADGRVRAANRVLAARAIGEGNIVGRDFARLLITDGRGFARFERDGLDGAPLRVLQIPFLDGDGAPVLVALLDDREDASAEGVSASSHARSLINLMPLGMALVDRDGRFMLMNDAFARAAAVDPVAPPLYPGDLVVREDKGAVADAVRRFAGGPTHSTDMAVRLAGHPDEPVVLTIAGARGLGDAAVLLSLKNNSEESRLKREVAQATKMQAVGQLAGGVAHDFNNILTAILGHCDLMLMRHSPGDSDYDDIQQIRTNSNRAAGLTRQLLAFSRQQTLRPQVLQLPDVVSEVSHLLKRLLGDATRLEISHGRALGAVRADPGQLEQVIVNLAVNARDAMPDGGTITVRTYGVAAAAVRHLGPDILPPGDYTALSVTDTGTGIAPADLPKIFEPFFTTKEVGKGTGLGLSTVYGIVKQSGGFIFADSELGRGTSFVIYLPVFAGALAEAVPDEAKAAPPALWGSGRILIVEDEDMVRSVAERALARQGYQVATAANGEEALEALDAAIAAGEAFDLVVSDVMMPVMDGPTMVAEARVKLPALPVLFMSGYAEEQLRKSIAIDNVSFLPKPFSVQQLAEATRDALAAAHEGRAAD